MCVNYSDKITLASLRVGDHSHQHPRIFILVPKTMSSEELQEEFAKFGEVESVQILKDRSTGESKVGSRSVRSG